MPIKIPRVSTSQGQGCPAATVQAVPPLKAQSAPWHWGRALGSASTCPGAGSGLRLHCPHPHAHTDQRVWCFSCACLGCLCLLLCPVFEIFWKPVAGPRAGGLAFLSGFQAGLPLSRTLCCVAVPGGRALDARASPSWACPAHPSAAAIIRNESPRVTQRQWVRLGCVCVDVGLCLCGSPSRGLFLCTCGSICLGPWVLLVGSGAPGLDRSPPGPAGLGLTSKRAG